MTWQMGKAATGVGLTAALLLPPLVGVAQEEARGGWGAYLGCWSSQAADEDEGNLCFVADGVDVEMLTIVDGAVLHREALIADGVRRDIARSGCRGIESNHFSDDGRRLYTSSETACAGGPLRRSTGVISTIGPNEWIDVRAIEANGVATPWSRRYERTGYGPLVEAGMLAEETALLFGPGVAVPRERGVTVILDPAPARQLPEGFLDAAAIITPNQTEAEALSGIAVETPRDAEKAAKAIRSLGIPTVILTLGSEGVYVESDDFRGHVPAFQVPVAASVAAGDAFNGALAVSLGEEMSLPDAARFSCAAAAISVSRPGSQESMAAREEVEAMLESALP